MVLRIEFKPPRKGCPEIGHIGEDEASFRNHYTGIFVPFASYPGAPMEEPKKRFGWFPGMEYFSPEHFVRALDYLGWEYHGKSYNGRQPHSRVSPNGKGTELESMPEDLFEYTFVCEEDLDRIMMNTQERMERFESLPVFSGTIHGDYLVQELYQSGWFWIYNACKDVKRIDIPRIWEMKKIPDVFKEFGLE
jgi:hypothetical protein